MKTLKTLLDKMSGYRTYAVAAFGFTLNALYSAGLLTDEGLHPQNWTLAFLGLAFLRAAVSRAINTAQSQKNETPCPDAASEKSEKKNDHD